MLTIKYIRYSLTSRAVHCAVCGLFTLLAAVMVLTGCAKSEGEKPAAEAAQAGETQLTECQLLMTNEEATLLGYDKQREKYPPDVRRRISMQAAQEGLNATTRSESMKAFNKAWRFDPENSLAYWGAAITRGCEAMKYNNDRTVAQKCWEDCLALFEKGSAFLDKEPPVRKVEFQLDQASAHARYGMFRMEDSKEQAMEQLEKAEALLRPYHGIDSLTPVENARVSARVVWQLKDICATLGKAEDAKSFTKEYESLPKELRRLFETPDTQTWKE